MNSRFKEDVQKLFEFWCEISPSANKNDKFAGNIIASFPENFKDPEILNKIPEFAYPCNFLNESVQSYSFVLTSSDSKWRFGFCRHDPKTQIATVIITYLPWHDTFLKYLNVLADIKKNVPNEFQPFLSEAYRKGVPEPGASLKLFYNAGTSNFMFQRPSQFQLPSIPENHNLNLYYNFVEAKNMISIFAAMLAERRIIFTSKRFDKLSSCVQAANSFLYPMIWQHIFIPILPMKMKEILCAPMPFLIGVPEPVLETMTRDELGDVVILNCDIDIVLTPFDDVKDMPAELVSQLKKQLNHTNEHIGDRISKIFLGILVQLIGGYRDAIKFTQGEKITWDRDTFIDSRPPNLRPFLRNMMELQIFQQFIEERLDMLNTGLGFSDEFELETLRHLEKSGRKNKNYKEMLKNFKDKTNPAVKSAVQSVSGASLVVKQGSKGVKTVYKNIKSNLREKTPPKSSQYNNHEHNHHISSWTNQHYDIGKTTSMAAAGTSSSMAISGGYGLDNDVAAAGASSSSSAAAAAAAAGGTGGKHHSAPNSPHAISAPFSSQIPPIQSLSLSSSKSSTSSKSNSSSDMNLLQELQQHALFKLPAVDRSLKPSTNNNIINYNNNNHHNNNNLNVNNDNNNNNNNNNNKNNNSINSIMMMDYNNTTNYGRGPLLLNNNTPNKKNSKFIIYDEESSAMEINNAILESYHQIDPTFNGNQLLVDSSIISLSSPSESQGGRQSVTSSLNFDCSPDVPSPPIPRPRNVFNTNTTIVPTNRFPNRNSNNNNNNNSNNNRNNNSEYSNTENDQLLIIDTDLITDNFLETPSGIMAKGNISTKISTVSSLPPSTSSTLHKQTNTLPLPLIPPPKSQSLKTPQPPAPSLPKSILPLSLSSSSSASASYSSSSSSSLSSSISTLQKSKLIVSNKQEDDDPATNLINLETQLTYELEDFDPLNQNAKELPTTSSLIGPKSSATGSTGIASGLTNASILPSTMLLNRTNYVQSYTNPVYPYFSPIYRNNLNQQYKPLGTQAMAAAAIAASGGSSTAAGATSETTRLAGATAISPSRISTVSLPATIPSTSNRFGGGGGGGTDEDLELLRKYGLDRFKLNDNNAVMNGGGSSDGANHHHNSSSSSSLSSNNFVDAVDNIQRNSNTSNISNNSKNNTNSDRNHWTTFD